MPGGAAASLKKADFIKPKHGNGECILVVDDEIAINEIICTTLTAYSYRVLTANSGLEAMEIFKDHPDIDLVITDMMMPGMDGPALADKPCAKSNPA